MICSGLVVPPGLAALRFGTLGPIAGKLIDPDIKSAAKIHTDSTTAWYQSIYGATTAFSWLQSAAMGGYGASAVYGGVRAASAAVVGVAEMFKWANGTA